MIDMVISGLVVSAVDCRSSGLDSSPGRGHCTMFLMGVPDSF